MSDGWTKEDAQVACRELGFTGKLARVEKTIFIAFFWACR